MIDAIIDRHPIDELVEDFLARRERGERPTMQEYVERHPEYAHEIRELFPAMFVMEGVRRQSRISVARPERLGDFRIVRELGRGGMGVVYEAEQESLGRRVALKVLPRAMLGSQTLVQRFHREVRAAARLHHTHIVPIFSVGEQDGACFYAMQLIDGHALDWCIDVLCARHDPPCLTRAATPSRALTESRTGPEVTEAQASAPTAADEPPVRPAWPSIPVDPDLDPVGYWRFAARVGAEAAEALDYAHRQRVLHRDIKPANLLLDADGQVWVLDFGLAKLLPRPGVDDAGEASDAITEPGDVLGTIRYMAPERFAGEADERSDVYSLGLTLYELLAVRPAFVAKDRVMLMQKILTTEPPPLRRVEPRVPADLATIVATASQSDSRRRYASAGDMAADLRRFLEGRPIHARRIGVAARAARWARRNPFVAGLLAAIVILTAGSFAAILDQRNEAVRNERVAAEERDQTRDANRQLRTLAHNLRLSNHAAKIQLADDAWGGPDGVRRCKEILDQLRPGDGVEDLRGFEWHYLNRLCHPDRQVLRWHASPIRNLARNRDGSRLATLAADGTLCVWDAAVGSVLRHWQAHPGQVTALAFSDDGAHLASAASQEQGGGVISVWDAHTGHIKRAIRPDALRVCSLHFSPDGVRLIAGCGRQSGQPNNYLARLRVYSTETGDELLAINDRGLEVAQSPDGSRLAAWTSDCQIKLLDARTGADLRSFESVPFLRQVVFSPDGRLLAAGGARGFVIWDAETGRMISRSEEKRLAADRLDFSPDGMTLAVAATYDSGVRLHDVATGRELRQLRGHAGFITGVLFSPDGTSLVSSSVDHTAAVWNLRAESNPRMLMGEQTGSADALAVSRDGRVALLGHVRMDPRTGEVRRSSCAWYVAAGRRLWSVDEPCAAYIASTSDGDRAVTWTANGDVTVRELATDKSLTTFREPRLATGGEVLVSQDGATIVCLSHACATFAAVYDGHSGRLLRELSMGSTFVKFVAFSADGTRLALATGDPFCMSPEFDLHVIDVATGNRVAVAHGFDGGHAAVLSLAFSPDGHRLVTTHAHGSRVWNAETLAEERRLPGHTVLVRAAAFSPDGRRLATAGFDRTVKLWDLESGQELLTLKGDAPFHSIAFDRAGTHLLAGCGAKLMVWDARPVE
jgi:WD40 repeat protein/serine/threonine protein kinase